jgi:hypothetical protein
VELYRGFSRSDTPAFREFLGPERLTSLYLPASVKARMSTPQGPLMNLGPLIHAHLDAYIPKIIKALHYKETAAIIPSTASVVFLVASNAQIGARVERLISGMQFREQPVLVRCSNARTGRPISEQFEYSYLRNDETGNAVFKIRLHQTFVVAVAIYWSGLSPDVQE